MNTSIEFRAVATGMTFEHEGTQYRKIKPTHYRWEYTCGADIEGRIRVSEGYHNAEDTETGERDIFHGSKQVTIPTNSPKGTE